MGDTPTDAQQPSGRRRQTPDYGGQEFGEDENFSLVEKAIITGLRSSLARNRDGAR
jgi:hypothetical protein